MPSLCLDAVNLYQCEPGFATERRVFDYDYLLYVHSGKGKYKIGGVTYDAAMGDLFYCPPFVGNTIMADETDPFLLSGLEFLAPDYREALARSYSLLPHRFLIEAIGEMVKEYRYGKNGAEGICGALLSVLLKNLKRMGGAAGNREPAQEILEYIAQNLHRPLTHKELSQVFSYHKNSVNRLLVRETGLSFKNYLIELRIRRASELLKYSGKSMEEIAGFCGYGSAVFFSRQFREKTGMTPLQFRKAHTHGRP